MLCTSADNAILISRLLVSHNFIFVLVTIENYSLREQMEKNWKGVYYTGSVKSVVFSLPLNREISW